MAEDNDKGKLTTLSVWESLKARLDRFKLAESQSYNDIIAGLADYFESKGKRGEAVLRRP